MFDSILRKQTNKIGKLLFDLTKKSAKIIMDETIKQNNKKAEFEIILFNAGYLLQQANEIRPNKIGQIQSDFFEVLINYLKINKLHMSIHQNIDEFINNRFVLNHNELIKISDGEGMAIPTKILYNFFEKPLQPESGDSHDLFKGAILMAALEPAFKILKEGAYLIIPKYY